MIQTAISDLMVFLLKVLGRRVLNRALDRPTLTWFAASPVSISIPKDLIVKYEGQSVSVLSECVFMLHYQGRGGIRGELIHIPTAWTCPADMVVARIRTEEDSTLDLSVVDNKVQVTWENLKPGTKAVIEVLCSGDVDKIRRDDFKYNIGDVHLDSRCLQAPRWGLLVAYMLLSFAIGLCLLMYPLHAENDEPIRWIVSCMLLILTFLVFVTYYAPWYWSSFQKAKKYVIKGRNENDGWQYNVSG